MMFRSNYPKKADPQPANQCPSNNCEIRKLCNYMHKLGSGAKPKWLAVVLFCRDLITSFSIFSDAQKKDLQESIFKGLAEKDHSDAHFEEITSIIEAFVTENSKMSDMRRLLEAEKILSGSLVDTISDFLKESLSSDDVRTKLVERYGVQTIHLLESNRDMDKMLPTLRRLLQTMLEHYREETQLWELKIRALEQKVTIDPLLAPLNNRGALEKHLRDSVTRARTHGMPLSLLMIDIDNFKKSVNDVHGHQVGDDVLRTMAKILNAHAQEYGCFAARYGGDEMTLVCEMSIDQASFHAEAIRMAVQSYEFRPRVQDKLADQAIKFTVSIGVAEYHPEWTAEQFLDAADQAMYTVKGAGKNSVARFCLIKDPSD